MRTLRDLEWAGRLGEPGFAADNYSALILLEYQVANSASVSIYRFV